MAEAQHHGPRPHRPFSVTLVLLGVFLIGLANGWRALGLFRQSGLLLDLGARPDPRLCAVASSAWSILLILLAFALWRRKPFTRLVVPVAMLAYGLFLFVLPGPCAPLTQSQDALSLPASAFFVAVFLASLALNVGPGRIYLTRDHTAVPGEPDGEQ